MSIRSLRYVKSGTWAPGLAVGALLLAAGIWPAGPAAAAQAAAAATPLYNGLQPDEFIKRWLVLAPIPVASDPAPDEATQRKAFAEDLLAAAGGESGIEPTAGSKTTVAGRELEWRLVESRSGVVELGRSGEKNDFAVAYAWADIEVPERTRALLGFGSDDAGKVWLNGKLVHENWTRRPARPDDDVVPVELQKGRNRLLVKVQNAERSWGLVCRLMGRPAQAQRLVGAARGGDIDTVKRLLEHGVEVDGRDRTGLTAAQAARLGGRGELLGLLASRGADTKAPLPPPAQSVDGLFGSVLEGQSPGAAVLVAKDGKIQLEKGYGLADVEGRVPVTAGTRFRIGSLTKQFTAAAILRLQEQGKLSVQDKLSKFIPDYPRGDEVTLHHLLSHTSGIHSYTNKPGFVENATTAATPEALIDSFKNDAFDFDPGQKWLYSNSGYFLLGYIVEKASGQPYGSYLRQAFFEPLGMKDTGVHVAGVPLEREALGYAFENGEVKRAPDWNMSKAGGAGSLYSTVGDLYRWDEAVFTGKVLQPANLQAALTPVKVAGDDPAQPKETGYGYGWQIRRTRGLLEINHGGGLPGFLSYLLRLPERRFTVAVLVNSAPPPPGLDAGRMANEIAELYLGETLPPREEPKAAATPSVQALDAIVGRYDYGGAILEVTREGDRVFAQLTGQSKAEIFPRSDTTFFWKVVEAEVNFVKNDKGVVTKAIHRQGGLTIDAARLEEPGAAPIDPKLYDALVGRYDYGGGKVVLDVTREGDRLFAQLTGQPKFEIFPKSETEFFWKVVNAQVTFVKDANGKVTKAIHQQGGSRLEAPKLE